MSLRDYIDSVSVSYEEDTEGEPAVYRCMTAADSCTMFGYICSVIAPVLFLFVSVTD